MTNRAFNCVVCATEFVPEEQQNIVLSKINVTPFKVCENCLNQSNPMNDYREVKKIINSYLKFAQAKQLFDDALEILETRKS